MSKWKSVIHAVQRTFMCCIRCTNIVDRMTKTMEEETNTPTSTSGNTDRKTSVAKIVITSADNNEEHLEFSQPITIKYMGNVLIHTENYYTPQATPNNSPRVSMEDNNPFVERLAPKRVRIKSEPIMVPGRYHSMSEIEQSFLKDILKEQADINQKQLVSRI